MISLLLLVLMAVGFFQLGYCVRALFALFGKRWSDAARGARFSLLGVVAYPVLTGALYFVQLHWGPKDPALPPSDALAHTISATMSFGMLGLFSVPLALLIWLVAFVARTRGVPDASDES